MCAQGTGKGLPGGRSTVCSFEHYRDDIRDPERKVRSCGYEADRRLSITTLSMHNYDVTMQSTLSMRIYDVTMQSVVAQSDGRRYMYVT